MTKVWDGAPDEARYAEITALVAERSGMVFAPNRRVEPEAGIARAMRHARADDLAAASAETQGLEVIA